MEKQIIPSFKYTSKPSLKEQYAHLFHLHKIEYINVTLVVEMKDKEFTSHKAKYSLQFGTNNNMIGLSLTFKSIK